MKTKQVAILSSGVLLLLVGAGCFRVSSDTQALRDAALESGFARADEKIEFGAGYFTVSLVQLATVVASKFVDIPPEARTVLSSLKQAECAYYEVRTRGESLATVLGEADKAMERRGCNRLVGVIEEKQLIAVYVPRTVNSARDLKASVLILTDKQLICATARADAEDLIQLAMSKVHHKFPAPGRDNLAQAEDREEGERPVPWD